MLGYGSYEGVAFEVAAYLFKVSIHCLLLSGIEAEASACRHGELLLGSLSVLWKQGAETLFVELVVHVDALRRVVAEQ